MVVGLRLRVLRCGDGCDIVTWRYPGHERPERDTRPDQNVPSRLPLRSVHSRHVFEVAAPPEGHER